MSIEAMAAVLHHSRAKGTAKLVLLGIANHQGDGGAWPTIATLARYANVTERAVQDAILKLTQSGELAVQRQKGGTADLRDWQRPNRYDVLVRCPQLCDGSTNHKLRAYPQARQLALVVPGMPEPDPVKPAAPGEASCTGAGEATFTQTVPINHARPTPVENLTTPRAREVDPARRAAALEQARAALAAGRDS